MDEVKKYALRLAEDGRIQYVTFDEFAMLSDPRVDTLPQGDITDYKYIDGEFVYDPWERPEEPASDADNIAYLMEQINTLIEDITNTQLALCDVYEMMEV